MILLRVPEFIFLLKVPVNVEKMEKLKKRTLMCTKLSFENQKSSYLVPQDSKKPYIMAWNLLDKAQALFKVEKPIVRWERGCTKSNQPKPHK